MKKIVYACAAMVAAVSIASADFTRLELGGGIWQQTPTGFAKRSDGDGALKLNGTYTSSEKKSDETYFWINFKHPLPLIPNLRAEYVTIGDEGSTKGGGSVGGINIPVGANASTKIDTKQYDVIPYYNLLDNTFWLTLDLGIDVKLIETTVDVSPVTGFRGYSSSQSAVIPLVYLRTRVQIPTTDLGVEADAKAITYNGNTVYDVRVKIDYTLEFVPVVQPAIEVGYRMQKLKIDDGTKAQVDLDYKGVYAGLMLRF
ncbi:MAG: TIGR04219 family outer membrane beta-barrel protein [Epsilonproteobacteria bacterium]|nr:TIGR04219 family outer membrane beta-barrel protein [Campylobacterota bacterium]